jgi:hypothetical protein
LDKSESWVYFVQSSDFLIKIGTTTNIIKRLRILRTYNPTIKVLLIKRGTIKNERKLHKKFDKYRFEGEWFEPSQEILDYIGKYNKKGILHFILEDNVCLYCGKLFPLTSKTSYIVCACGREIKNKYNIKIIYDDINIEKIEQFSFSGSI